MDAQFVLTGKFVTGTRTECELEIVEHGGLTNKSPTRNTRFVVIGNLGSTGWAQSNYGRKINTPSSCVNQACLST